MFTAGRQKCACINDRSNNAILLLTLILHPFHEIEISICKRMPPFYVHLSFLFENGLQTYSLQCIVNPLSNLLNEVFEAIAKLLGLFALVLNLWVAMERESVHQLSCGPDIIWQVDACVRPPFLNAGLIPNLQPGSHKW